MSQPTFDLTRHRPIIEQALGRAGFELLPDPSEPNLLQARTDRDTDTQSLVLDAGGQLRYTHTRPTASPQSQIQTGQAGRNYHLTRQTAETLIVSYRLTDVDATNFAALLHELTNL